MSEKSKEIKKVEVKESDLVNLLDNIVNEAVKVEKKKWLAEQKVAETEKDKLVESRIADLEAKLSKLIK